MKIAVSAFLKEPLPNRIEDFLRQYLHHVERNVLKNTDMTERMRNTLRCHKKVFHSLANMLEEDSVRAQCDDAEYNMLESIVAVQQEVETELFEFTKQMMSQHGYKRFFGLGHWVTIEMPGLKEALIQAGLVTERESAPFVFGFDSTPHCFRVQIWIYKKATLYSMTKGRLPHFSPERPEASRLVEVIFQRTIISSEKIIQESLSGLKQIIAEYFRSELNTDLAEASRRIGAWANTIQTPNNKGCIAAQPATTPLVEQARRKRGR